MALTQPQRSTEEDLAMFKRVLRQSKPALDYLESRGYTLEDAERFEMGVAPASCGFWFTLMRGRLVVPIRDAHGRLKAFAGRMLEYQQPQFERSMREAYASNAIDGQGIIDKWANTKWLNEPNSEHYVKGNHLYGLHTAAPAAEERGYIVLVEGYMDAIMLSKRFMENTSALCGTNLTEMHCAIISRSCDEIIQLMDGDKAGRKANEKTRVLTDQYGLTCRSVYLPEGYDPDTFVLKFGGKQLRRAIEKMRENDQQELNIHV